jgi:hypothetical protein
MKKKLVDKLCKNWTFNKEKYPFLDFEVDGKQYTRKIYNNFYPEHAYINFNDNKYYFE